MGFDYSFFVEKAAELHKPKITPELLEEMDGIAAGLTKAGVPTTLDDIIGWNAYMEMTGYWWPTVASQYVSDAPDRQPQEPLLAPSSPRARPPPTAAS